MGEVFAAPADRTSPRGATQFLEDGPTLEAGAAITTGWPHSDGAGWNGRCLECSVQSGGCLAHLPRSPGARRAPMRLSGECLVAVASLLEHENRTGELIGVLLTGVSALTELANADWSADIPAIGVSAIQRWADTARQLRRVEVVVPAPETSEASSLLSEREIEVLQRVAEGESNKLIARTLNLSPHTSSDTWRASSSGWSWPRAEKRRTGTASASARSIATSRRRHPPAAAPRAAPPPSRAGSSRWPACAPGAASRPPPTSRKCA